MFKDNRNIHVLVADICFKETLFTASAGKGYVV
jgi:hypothetical protein